MGVKSCFGFFALFLSACNGVDSHPSPKLPTALEIFKIEIAAPDWIRILKKQGKDWYVFQDDRLLGPAKASVALRALEVLVRDRSRLPESALQGCTPVLLLRGSGTGPTSGLSVCKSDRDLYVSTLDQDGKPSQRGSPAVRDGTQVLVSTLVKPDDLLDRHLISWNGDRVKVIEIRARGKARVLERQGVLWTSPVAQELLKATLTEIQSPPLQKEDLELTVRGLNEEPIVIRGKGRLFTVSNRPGIYRSSLPVATIEARLNPRQ